MAHGQIENWNLISEKCPDVSLRYIDVDVDIDVDAGIDIGIGIRIGIGIGIRIGIGIGIDTDFVSHQNLVEHNAATLIAKALLLMFRYLRTC